MQASLRNNQEVTTPLMGDTRHFPLSTTFREAINREIDNFTKMDDIPF
jgi:hypothetical protein